MSDETAQQVYSDVIAHHGDQPPGLVSFLMNSYLRALAWIRGLPEREPLA
jgi:hypothetical protein